MKEFDKVIGYESIKEELISICDVLKNPDVYEKLNVKCPRGIIFSGDPGVGKTLMAECFIEAVGWNYYVCRKDRSDGEFVNQIKNIFEKAKENAPSIILLDDVDKFENEQKSNSNAECYVTIQSCMDNIKDYKIFVIATANDSYVLPKSLIRPGRLEQNLYFETPDNLEAERIVKYYLSKKKTEENINYSLIARILRSSSCAILERVINRAGMKAGFENRDKIGMNDIIIACVEEMYGSPRMWEKRSKEVQELIAYHEAGHVVAGEILQPGTVSVATILPYYGKVGGFVDLFNDDDYYYDINKMYNRVMILLGGKIAFEQKFGKTDVCAVDDVERAIKLAERFVKEYYVQGFDKTGLNAHIDDKDSQILKARQENYIYAELNMAYRRVREIIVKNFGFVEKIAETLVEKEIITSDDIIKIKNNIK